MIALVLLLAAADPSRILILDLAHAGVSADDSRVLVTAIAEGAATTGANVVTSADLRTLTDVAAEQQECGLDSTSCLAELAGAMDVQRVLHGTVSRVDEQLLVQLRCYDARNPAASERVSYRGASMSALLDATPNQVRTLLGAAPIVDEPSLSPVWGGVVLGAGALAAGGTAIAGGIYNASLTDRESSRASKDDALGVGRVVVVVGSVVSLGLGAAGAVLLALSGGE